MLTCTPMALANLGKRLFERAAQSLKVGIDHGSGVRKRVPDVRGYVGARSQTGKRVLVGACGIARVSHLFQVRTLLQ